MAILNSESKALVNSALEKRHEAYPGAFPSGSQGRRPGQRGSARSGPGASAHLPSENLIQLAFPASLPCYVKVLAPRLAEAGAAWGGSILLLLQQVARDQNHEYHRHHFIPKGPEPPFRSKCWGEVGSG